MKLLFLAAIVVAFLALNAQAQDAQARALFRRGERDLLSLLQPNIESAFRGEATGRDRIEEEPSTEQQKRERISKVSEKHMARMAKMMKEMHGFLRQIVQQRLGSAGDRSLFISLPLSDNFPFFQLSVDR